MPAPHRPVRSSAHVTVSAPAERVWDLLADPKGWSTWFLPVVGADLGGDRPLTEGVRFRWRLGVGTVVSEVVAADGRQLVWRSRYLGLRTEHAWMVRPVPEGTHVTSTKTVGGIPARLGRPLVQRWVDRTLQEWVDSLSTTAPHLSEPEGVPA